MPVILSGAVNITSAFEAAIELIKTDVVTMITTALPVGLGIVGMFMTAKLGIKFFRSIT